MQVAKSGRRVGLWTNDNTFCYNLESIQLEVSEDFLVVEVQMTAANEKRQLWFFNKLAMCPTKETKHSHYCTESW